MRILVLNGPPGVGKDTAAHMLGQWGWIHEKLSTPLKNGMKAIFRLTEIEARNFEAHKRLNERVLPGLTWREGQIWLSEEAMKPKFGKDIFAKILLSRLNATQNYVISDCGFQAEYEAIASCASTNIIQIERRGCSFAGDSRHWVYHTTKSTPRIANDSSFNFFATWLKRHVTSIGWGP